MNLLPVFFLLMLCSMFFSGSETAIFSLSKLQVHRFREVDTRTAARLIELLKAPRRTLVTILFGNELANICISIVGAAIVGRMMQANVRVQTIVAIATITPIVMVFCEIIPKNVALRFAEQAARFVALPIGAFAKLIAPLREVLTWFAKKMVVLFGGTAESAEPMVMEEEYRRLVDMGLKEGAIEEEEREIIHNVFEFTDKRAGDIMTPAERIFALPIDLPYERLMEDLASTQWSRVPFYEGDRANVVGILHVRDLFTFNMRRKAGESPELRAYLKEPLFVAAATPLEDLLREFQRTRMHMAIVLGEAGDIRGLVTMDDVQEEMFGEIEE
ncbi:MAG: HlyC/CorC family transporter [Proteobacteria bacterium]|nr:HlyC/CorC family transporter [Pseudomonadota bacterium]